MANPSVPFSNRASQWCVFVVGPLILALVSGSLTALEHEERVWTEASGNHQILARFVELDWPTVVLSAKARTSESAAKDSRESSRTIRVHFERLIGDDQQYVTLATMPHAIDAQPVRLDLKAREQRISLPVPALPPPWEYEVRVVAIRVKGEPVSMSMEDESPGQRDSTSYPSRRGTLTDPGNFHAPIRVNGNTALFRAVYRLKRFEDTLFLTIQPTINVDQKFIPFAAQPLEKEAEGRQKGLMNSRSRLAQAQRELQVIPGEIGRTRSKFVPADTPGSQFINGQVSQRLRLLETGLQRAQRNVRSLTSSIPRDTARLALLKTVYDLVQGYSGDIEIDFVVRRQFKDVTQLMLAANPQGTVTLTASSSVPSAEAD